VTDSTLVTNPTGGAEESARQIAVHGMMALWSRSLRSLPNFLQTPPAS